MTTISATKARNRLYSLIDEANESHFPIRITGKRGNAVLARISHKIRSERTEVECWRGFRADSGVKPGRHPAKSRIQGNPRQCRHTGAQQKICEICGLVSEDD